MTTRRMAAMTWDELSSVASRSTSLSTLDPVHGKTNSQSKLRLFGSKEEAVRVTLYRDNHAWCPYCQKVWLWLEEKRVPYKVEKVTMFCYGKKEAWYKQKVPSGMLPALELDGRVITESDVILHELEKAFGPLHKGMADPAVVPLRRLERALFQTWCGWLCYPNRQAEERRARENFEQVAEMVEEALATTPGAYFLEEFSTVDAVFTPYVERMSASLFYYKGWVLRDPERRPRLSAWFDAMENRPTYLGTQSDCHTHAHDLPPQMGGCYASGTPEQDAARALVDEGPFVPTNVGLVVPDTAQHEPEGAAEEALARTIKHRRNLIAANAVADKALVDEALRCALTNLANSSSNSDAPLVAPPKGSDAAAALRYVRDRVNVPRDMSLWAARRIRSALEATAALAGPGQGPPIPTQHRKDQNPLAFAPVR
jgi:glutathione S-transferase